LFPRHCLSPKAGRGSVVATIKNVTISSAI
jgi:hypothetical protein